MMINSILYKKYSSVFYIFVLGFVVRIVFVFIVQPVVRGPLDVDSLDPDKFGARAENILNGNGFVDVGTGKPELSRDPVYSYVIAGIWKISGQNTAVIQVLNAALGGVSSALIFVLAYMLYGRVAGMSAALIFIFFPLNIYYLPMYRYEALSTSLMALMGVLFLKMLSGLNLKIPIILGVLMGLAALTTSSLVLMPGVFLVTIFVDPRIRHHIWRMTLAIVVMLATLAPWIYRNYLVSGGDIIITRRGSVDVFWLGTFAVTDYDKAPMQLTRLRKNSQARIEALILDRSGKSSIDQIGPKQKEVILKQAILDLIKNHPGQMIIKVIMQAVRFWYLADSIPKSIFVVSIQLPVLVFAVWGIFHGIRRKKPLFFCVLVILAFNLSYATIWVEARYTIPLEPFLMSLAGLGLSAMPPIKAMYLKFNMREETSLPQYLSSVY